MSDVSLYLYPAIFLCFSRNGSRSALQSGGDQKDFLQSLDLSETDYCWALDLLGKVMAFDFPDDLVHDVHYYQN